MNATLLADRIQLTWIIRRYSVDEIESRTIARGTASAPALASAAHDGMWFFLGVDVDARTLTGQEVNLVRVEIDGAVCHVLYGPSRRQVIAASHLEPAQFLAEVSNLNIHIQWHSDI